MFKENDHVVYPGHGLGVIKKICDRDLNGKTCKFYEVHISRSGATLLVPVDQASTLRAPASRFDVRRIMATLSDDSMTDQVDPWNVRYARYMSYIGTGDLTKITAAVKELGRRKNEQDLSYGERKLFESALACMAGEIAVAEGISEDEAAGMILDALE